ncbi:MAG: hypothetical protein CYG60_11440 [Actinobacteria bacterium]|nr:MAG: hypothetical protein CYG60_11440 [Actinomycetota bacterium]
MDAPQEAFYPEPRTEDIMVLFRIISRESWDELQDLHEALPGSRIEHLLYGLYVLFIGPGGAKETAK